MSYTKAGRRYYAYFVILIKMDTPERSSFRAIIFQDFGLPNSPTKLVIYLSSSQNKQQKVRETVLYLTTEYIKKFPAANFLCLFRFYVLRRLEWTFSPRTHNLDPDYNSDSHDSSTVTSRAQYHSIIHRNAIILPRKYLNLRDLGTCR